MKMYLGRKPANAEGRLKKASKNGIQALDAGKRPKFRKSDRNGEKFVAEIVSKRRDRESKLDSVKDSLTSRKWAVQKKLATGKFTIDAKPKGLGAGRRTPDDVTGKNKGKTRLKNVILEGEKPKGKLARSSPSGTVKKFSKIRVSEMDDREGKGRKVHNKTEDRTHKIERNSASREKSQKEAGEMVPKKSKRVIRIDPHDISNKRVDDGPTAANAMQKVPDKETNLSQNAQFRAIKPSKEILSFVEDNLLGRRRLIELRRAGYNVDISAPLDNIPFSTSTERERIEDNVFRNKLTFFAAAKVSSSFPPAEIPEIAFAGRSNVGKSSLLNALTRQWGVVRTSDKPGLTQTINFFKLTSKLSLVDLPGYGFAYAKEEVKDAWEELVKEYVSTRVGLRRVCLLIDTKWGMKPRDCELISLMERSQTKYQIVLTKTDAVFPLDVARRAMQIQEGLKKNESIVEPVMMVSSKSGAGIRSLRAILSKIVRVAKI